MNVLITGSSGFLGKEVVNILNKQNFNLKFISRRKIKKKNYIFCNLNNINKLKYILKSLKVDAVINLVAEVNFLKKTTDMYNVNSKCPYEIAKYCKKNKIHLIHISGTIVNGIKKTYSKKTKLNPINHYGKSKLMGDNLIIKTKCNYTILRLGGIYGKNGPEHLGINKFIKFALSGKSQVFKGNKKNLRNYIFVKDAAKHILFCLKNKKYGIYYIGGEILSFEKMLKSINKILSKKKNLYFLNKQVKSDNQIIKTDETFKYTSFSKSLKLI
jgi:dTDP-4-dehydrorhamnose reductase